MAPWGSLSSYRKTHTVVRKHASNWQKAASAETKGRGLTVTCDVYFAAIIDFTITKMMVPLEIRKVKIKFNLEQATEVQEYRCICTLSLTSALDGGGWSTPRPGRFTPGKAPVPIV